MATPGYTISNIQVYTPQLQTIAAITNSNPAIVTTDNNHGYSSGLVVRLDVPNNFGMFQINQLVSAITVTGLNTFSADQIDSTLFDVFSVPAIPGSYYSEVVPIGEINSILNLATVNRLG